MTSFLEINKCGGSNKTCRWEKFLKKNKICCTLIEEFRVGTFYAFTSYIPQEKKYVSWNFKNTFAQLCGKSQWAQSNADQVKGKCSGARWSNLVEQKGKLTQKWLIPYSIHFPGKITKLLINKNFENTLAPLCAPIQCRSV